MRIRLIDQRSERKEVEWGTCELCTTVGPFDFVEFKFLPDDGSEAYWVEAYYHEAWYGPIDIWISNVFDFAAWLAEKEFPDGTEITTEDLVILSNEYEDHLHD